MQTVNIGILAHVDAGKTSLTERILFETGVIPAIGRVDHGTTHTDTLEMERQRGITIQSAVVSFTIGNLKVNLIDTPGHPDFIAEVERALGVVDGVIVVISAVEGIQAQTRKLVRAVVTSGTPLILFVNKIDRAGAREHALLEEIRRALHLRVLPMHTVTGIGTAAAQPVLLNGHDPGVLASLVDVLTEVDDTLLETYLAHGGQLDAQTVQTAFTAHARRGHVSPAYFGSAITGAGATDLLDGIARFLPPGRAQPDQALAGTCFKIQRDRTGEKIVFFRIFAGRLQRRQHVTFRRLAADGEWQEHQGRVTAIDTFVEGEIVAAQEATGGEIVRLHGLKEMRIGDTIGDLPGNEASQAFSPPALESVVLPCDPSRQAQLNAALAQLAEQDPLITIRRDTRRGGLSVLLYGEVQKEVIGSRLDLEFGVPVTFATSHVICIETPIGTGSAVEYIGAAGNPFAATVGFRIEPGESGSGIAYHRELGSLPLSFYKAIEETVRDTLQEGVYGWSVTDCVVTLTDVGYSSPVTTAGDFRKLTPLVLMQALKLAGTTVREPIQHFTLEVPVPCVGEATAALGAARAIVRQGTQSPHGAILEGSIPTAEVDAFERRLPGVSRGEGVLECRFDSFAPISGVIPRRARTDFDPLNRKLYLAQLSQM